MPRIPGTMRSTSLVLSLIVAAFVPGCGPSEVAPSDAAAIPVYNPSPDNPTKDITLENEAENLKKIGGISR